jgi:hypothetical protein
MAFSESPHGAASDAFQNIAGFDGLTIMQSHGGLTKKIQ